MVCGARAYNKKGASADSTDHLHGNIAETKADGVLPHKHERQRDGWVDVPAAVG